MFFSIVVVWVRTVCTYCNEHHGLYNNPIVHSIQCCPQKDIPYVDFDPSTNAYQFLLTDSLCIPITSSPQVVTTQYLMCHKLSHTTGKHCHSEMNSSTIQAITITEASDQPQ